MHVTKNITIGTKLTSVRLEPEFWRAFEEITVLEKCSYNDIATLIYLKKSSESSFTSALRTFIMLYYRSASTKDGHEKAGHGDFNLMQDRASRIKPAPNK